MWIVGASNERADVWRGSIPPSAAARVASAEASFHHANQHAEGR